MTIEERIESLERDLSRVRRLNRWGGVLMLLALGAAIAGVAQQPGAKPGPIRATELRIVDKNGQPRAMLAVVEDEPVLTMTDEKRNIRTLLKVDQNGPGLRLLDRGGQLRAMLAVVEDAPVLSMWDEKRNIRALLEVGESGPSLRMLDEKGEDRAALGTVKTSSPDGVKSVYPESTLMLLDADGKIVWKAP